MDQTTLKTLSPLSFPKVNQSALRVLLAYVPYSERTVKWYDGIEERANKLGWNIKTFPLYTGSSVGSRLNYSALNQRWKKRDKSLLRLSDRLRDALSDADVLWNFNGANIHPEWLCEFDTLNVYSCFDDPEAIRHLSKPVAKYFDASLVGNLGVLPIYAHWGIKDLAWAPLAFTGDEYDPELTAEKILSEERTNDIVFFGERESPRRRERFSKIANAFPDALFFGKGWPSGFIDDSERKSIYRNTKIGWNIHNSLGPVNLRVFALLSYGIMQICDNKCRLGQVFELGKEIVGFDMIEECIDLTRYYLDHDQERREIAANGFLKYQKDYCEEELWKYYFAFFEKWVEAKKDGEISASLYEPSKSQSPIKQGLQDATRIIGNRVLQPFNLKVVRNSKDQKDMNIVASPKSVPYIENEEAGGKNMAEKLLRAERGEWFEWPNIVALNWYVATLVGHSRRIIEIGSGTGCFAYEAAADPKRQIVAVDIDQDAVEWAKKHRRRPNIEYQSRIVKKGDGEYDLVVSLDVIEHIKDYGAFLNLCRSLSPRCILSTPNRLRSKEANHAGPPKYYQHVREWTAGEFYWVLKSFYNHVRLYVMPSPYLPDGMPCDVNESNSQIIAVCENKDKKV